MRKPSEPEQRHLSLVRTLAATLPKFDDGRVDYTTSPVAPVVNCIVWFAGRVLLLQRSEQVGEGKQTWSGVDGYIDRPIALEDIILAELREELGVLGEDIERIAVADSYESYDPKAGVKWIVFPVLVQLTKRPEIKLDWEHTQYRWIEPNEIHDYNILPGQDRVLRLALALL